MDKIEAAAAVVAQLNQYRAGEISVDEIIRHVCNYFDDIKSSDLTQADVRFLKFLANSVGIPHYFDLLNNFRQNLELDEFDLTTLAAIIYESSLNTTIDRKLHKFQKEILNLFTKNHRNRFFLSASTSFGKTHLVFEIIQKMEYRNVVLLFPTIALLSENLERLTLDEKYAELKARYAIHTLSDAPQLRDSNIFIYTPERFLSHLELTKVEPNFDFIFIDEVYKIDNGYIIDEQVKEDERDVAYRLAVHHAALGQRDLLLAGPYVEFSRNDDVNYNPSFDNFLNSNLIKLLDYNRYEIVTKDIYEVKSKRKLELDKELSFEFASSRKDKILAEIVRTIRKTSQTTIVYCYSTSSVESYARKLIASSDAYEHDSSSYSKLLQHVEKSFIPDWVVVKALKAGIGIHHGLVPKYIQKEIVSLFNRGLLNVLISTTTITEGVNTAAKNLIVLHSKKGEKNLLRFDAKNIAGRAGRFLRHYRGRVITIQNDFKEILESESAGIRHRNYDVDATKDVIDLFYTSDDYLSEDQIGQRGMIRSMERVRTLPEEIMSMYQVVSRLDKIIIYDSIVKFTNEQFQSIESLIRKVNIDLDINYDGFQLILDTVQPIVHNKQLLELIIFKPGEGEYSLLTHLVHFYLLDGFMGSVQYNMLRGDDADHAIRKTSRFVYSTLKYQAVKFIGIFNLMYKLAIAKLKSRNFEDVPGLDRLLVKLEYNALTDFGRVASDYGVPAAVVNFYENPASSDRIAATFDDYEREVFARVESILNK